MHNDAETPSLLEEKSLFVFDPQTHQEALTFFLASKPDLDPSSALLRELTYLTAAEFSLAPIFVEPRQTLPVPEPIPVDVAATRLALAKANCIMMEWCSGQVSEGTLRLPDITAYGGDVTKLETVGLLSHEPPTEIGDLARAIDALEHAHRGSPAELGQRIGNSGVLRLQGFLWAVKLSLPRGNLAQAVADAYDAFELHQPVGGVVEA